LYLFQVLGLELSSGNLAGALAYDKLASVLTKMLIYRFFSQQQEKDVL